jgi:hypothetical protein
MSRPPRVWPACEGGPGTRSDSGGIAALRPRAHRYCASCGVAFVAHEPYHRRCRPCWSWHVASISIGRAMRAIREGT